MTVLPVLSILLGLTNALSLGPQLQFSSARIKDYPYLVSVRLNDEHGCGGSIISESQILTAAHCVANIDVAQLTVRLGSTQHLAGDSYAVRSAAVHPSFNQTHLDCDVAILTLARDMPFGPFVRSIELAEAPPTDGALANVMGWSDLPQGGSSGSGPTLQVGSVRLISRASCRALYGNNVITASMVCADGKEFGTDPCQLDSGSPLVDKSTGRQVGVVSWVGGCFRPALPMVYASVGVLVKSREVYTIKNN